MLMLCIVLSVVCIGISVFMGMKHERLVGETRQVKQDYLKAKTSYLQIDDQYREVCNTLSDVYKLNRGYKKSLDELTATVKEQHQMMHELREEVDVLKEENRVIKKRLGIYDSLAPHCTLDERVVKKL